MTSINSEFNPKAAGLPSFEIQGMFTKMADAVSAKVGLTNDASLDNTFGHNMA